MSSNIVRLADALYPVNIIVVGDFVTFAQRLSQVMDERNLSAYRVSKDTEISTGLLSLYRAGKNDPSSQNLIKLADYFDVSIDYLVGRSDAPKGWS